VEAWLEKTPTHEMIFNGDTRKITTKSNRSQAPLTRDGGVLISEFLAAVTFWAGAIFPE
jgi:hypothetical protein